MSTYRTHKTSTSDKTEGRCSDRPGTASSNAGSYYVSEPCQGPGLTVHLKEGDTLLDRFTIKSRLGQGNGSRVYLAADTVRAQDIALKVVAVASEEVAAGLRREIDLHSKVTDYRHVLRVYDVHSTAYQGIVLLLISMEYADGGSLRQWLWQNEDNVCKRQTEGLLHFKHACRGVQALHEVGIVHLDLKPENLLFARGVLKVSDLGLSRHMGDGQMNSPGEPGADLQLPPGTPEYMSSEQIMAAHPGDVDLRADLYSLGVVLYEICDPRCRRPFGGTRDQLRQRHLHVPAPALEMANANVVRVVATCLQKNPSDRYKNIAKLIDDLERGDGEEPHPTLPADPPPQPMDAVAALWQQACRLRDTGDLQEAGRLCDRILNLSPADGNARHLRDEVERRFTQAGTLYARIGEGIGRQSLNELARLLQEAVATYPNHPNSCVVQEQLLSATRGYREAMDNAVEAIHREQWQEARTHLGRAQRLNPGLPMISGLLAVMDDVERRIGAARAQVDAAIEQGDRDGALAWARAIDRYVERIKRSARQRPT